MNQEDYLDAQAVARIGEAREKAASYLVTMRTEAERLLRRAHAANEGFFDFDVGGVRYAAPQALELIAEGRTRAMIHYFDAMVWEYFSVTASVEAFQTKLQDLATEAMDAFQGDSESLNSRKREWAARSRGRLALRSAMVERSHATFWRDLELQFRALNWPDLAAVLNNGWWSISGHPSDRSQREILVNRFISLVGRALGILGFHDSTVVFAVWSDHLQKNSPHSVGGCINNLSAASAEACLLWILTTEEKPVKFRQTEPRKSSVARNILADSATRKFRRDLLNRYRLAKNINTMSDLAFHLKHEPKCDRGHRTRRQHALWPS